MFHSKFLITTSVLMSALPCIASGRAHNVSENGYITDTLEVSTVIAEKGFTVSREDTVSLKGLLRTEDALMKIPGLLVNDMGGPGGLKTVSLRGLGSAQTAIFIDGVRVGNLMSGQSDLSMISLGNFSRASVDYAQNSISFTTAVPQYMPGRKYTAGAALKAGSFGTYMPELSFGYRIADNVNASVNAAALFSNGHRQQSGISQYHGSLDFAGQTSTVTWKAKAYFNHTDRDCPGSTAYPALSHQKDLNAFIQGSADIHASSLYTVFLSAKAAYDNMKYKDDYSSSDYDQAEVQINSSHIFKAAHWCDVAFSASGKWNGLSSSNYTMPSEGLLNRFGLTAAGSASFHTEIIKAKASLEYLGAYDKGNSHRRDRHFFCPGASIRVTAVKGLDIIAFGKRSCHIPTFNDLYYMGSGNSNLKPEDAWLTDIGLEWRTGSSRNESSGREGGWTICAKADGFFNYLTDKITWAPSPEDAYIWLPYNIGKVRAAGADLSVSTTYTSGNWKTGGSARYSFQDARDRTPGSYTFDSPVPYIARHTVVLTGEISYKGWRIEAIWNFRDGRSDSSGKMPSWNTLDLNASKTFRIKKFCELDLTMTARNITDFRYEISSGYPMPGWGLYGGFAVRL